MSQIRILWQIIDSYDFNFEWTNSKKDKNSNSEDEITDGKSAKEVSSSDHGKISKRMFNQLSQTMKVIVTTATPLLLVQNFTK